MYHLTFNKNLHFLKGTGSRDLRWLLLYINQKLFHKILILLKGHFKIYKIKIQRQNGSAILDGLHNSRCGSFHCVHAILDDALSARINTQGFHHFLHFGPCKCILELWYQFYCHSRWWGPPYSVIHEYEVALKNLGFSVA